MENIGSNNVMPTAELPNKEKSERTESNLPSVNDEDHGWLIRNASEMQSSCAVVMVLILAFSLLSAIANGSAPWITNQFVFLVLVGIFTTAFLGFCFFAWQVVRGEALIRDSAPHVLSSWSLRTLKAAGLSRDLSARLQEILDHASDSASKINLIVIGRERAPDSWITDLESTFGQSRVAEFEDMLFKYTAREAKN